MEHQTATPPSSLRPANLPPSANQPQRRAPACQPAHPLPKSPFKLLPHRALQKLIAADKSSFSPPKMPGKNRTEEL